MYEYKYVTIFPDGLMTTKYHEYREAIDEGAAQGWRYVGYMPTRFSGHGVMTEIDLIFEREV